MTAGSVDLMDLLRGIWRRKLMVLLVTILFAGAAAFVVLRASPSYTVESQVLIDNLETPFSRAEPSEGSDRLGKLVRRGPREDVIARDGVNVEQPVATDQERGDCEDSDYPPT